MWFILLATLIIGGLLLYLYLSKTSTKNYWKKYGVKEIDTSKALTTLDFFLGRKTLLDKDDFVYKNLGPDKFCGFIEMGKPMILVKDIDLLKKILIKDFDHFVDRRRAEFFQGQGEVLQKMLIALSGDEWKGVRSSVSPTFTTGKIRRMMTYFNSVGKEWVEDLISKAKQSGNVTVDMLKTANYYTIDVIASAVFGMNAGTIKDNNSSFAKMATTLADFNNKKQMIKFAMILLFPRVSEFFKVSLFNKEALEFFRGILEQGLKARLSGQVKRNDFLQLLVDAKNGELKAAGADGDELSSFEKDAQVGATEKKQYLTEDVMNAQSLIFFFAGFSTTSHFISFAAYSLAAYQDVQEKLRKEVNKIAKPDGGFEYDEVGQLPYLEKFVSEVLRKFPGSNRLERLCVKDYKDEETDLFVPKGTIVVIPCYSMHTDGQYFHNPDGFDPEHFCAEQKAERNPYVYMPFGIGPRNCIGMRFALMESKTAIAHLVHNFLIEPTEKMPLPVQGKNAGFAFIPPKNLELKLTPIHH